MLSAEALTQMRLHMERSGIRVDDANREAYRELARAGIMYPVSGFVSGPEAYFRFTEAGWDRRHEILACAQEIAQHTINAIKHENPCSAGFRGDGRSSSI